MMKLLFLAANPNDTSPLQLDEEIRAIDAALRRTQFYDQIKIVQHWAVRDSEIQDILRRHQPQIVHFSGHGSSTAEIILKDDNGNSQPVSSRAIRELFSFHEKKINCVVLSACYSDSQAVAIAEHIDYVIGMSDVISDIAAIRFSSAFYEALGYGEDIETAFRRGCLQIDLGNLNEHEKPKLTTSQASSPSTKFFDSNQTLASKDWIAHANNVSATKPGCYVTLGKFSLAVVFASIIILIWVEIFWSNGRDLISQDIIAQVERFITSTFGDR